MPTLFKRRRRRVQPTALLGVCTLAGLVLLTCWQASHTAAPSIAQQVPKLSKPILFFDKGRGHFYHEANTSCPVPWEWTTDEEAADALLYNVLDNVQERAGVTPQRKRPDQKLVFFSLESGHWYPVVYKAKEMGYDLQIDYRLGGATGAADVPAVYLNSRLVYEPAGDFRAPPKLPKRSDALLSAFISNCAPNNNRTKVLQRLQELIPVHSYGSCLHNKDSQVPKGDDRYIEKRELAGQYLFGAAMENSDDPSYVTEKVYHMLEAGSIPLYMGAPDIHRFVPRPESIIRVEDFPSVEALAHHMQSLAEDPVKIAEHFEWKKKPWSEGFQEVQRLADTGPHCRLAMLMAGTPFKWQAHEVAAASKHGWLW